MFSASQDLKKNGQVEYIKLKLSKLPSLKNQKVQKSICMKIMNHVWMTSLKNSKYLFNNNFKHKLKMNKKKCRKNGNYKSMHKN